jgi:hypothetical protein
VFGPAWAGVGRINHALGRAASPLSFATLPALILLHIL